VSFPNQFLESSLVKADLIDPSGTTVTRVKFYSETAYERQDIPLVTQPPLAPRILTLPKIYGTETELSRLWAEAGKVDDNAIPVPVRTWQWYKDGVAIVGATNQYYDLLTADIGSTIYVEQIETNTPDPIAFPDNQVVAQSAPTGVIEYRQPKIQQLPRVQGFGYVGHTLEAKLAPVIDNVSGVQEFQWLRDGVEIPGATGLTYVLNGLDVGNKVAFRQREINGDKQDEEVSIGVFVRVLV